MAVGDGRSDGGNTEKAVQKNIVIGVEPGLFFFCFCLVVYAYGEVFTFHFSIHFQVSMAYRCIVMCCVKDNILDKESRQPSRVQTPPIGVAMYAYIIKY